MFVGDGSYMMMNSDLYSSVLSGHKLIVIVCDNGGFAVINRLQVNQGGEPFNNLIDEHPPSRAGATSTSPRTPRRWVARPRRRRRSPSWRPRSNGRARRPHHGDRHEDGRVRLDRRAARSGRSACRRSSDRPPVHDAKAAMESGNKRSGSLELTGKLERQSVIVISGGTQGLGEAVARKLVDAGCGGTGDRRSIADRGEALANELTGLGTPTSFVAVRHGRRGRRRWRSSRPATRSSASSTEWSTSPPRRGAQRVHATRPSISTRR